MRTIRYSRLAVVAAIVSATAAAAAAAANAPLTPKQALLEGRLPSAPARIEREQAVTRLIVRFRENSPEGAAASDRPSRVRALATASRTDLRHVREIAGGSSVVSFGTAVPLSAARQMAARLAADPAVEYAEPDVMYKRLAVPNEARYAEWQWNLFPPSATYTGAFLDSAATRSVPATGGGNLPLAWDLSGGGSGTVVVAVIDTGIVNHLDLNGVALPAPYTPAARFVAGFDFVSSQIGSLPAGFVENDGPLQAGRDDDPTDPGDWLTTTEEALYPACDDGNLGPQNSSWHGSHMAGTVAATANNALGIAGIGWNVRVQPIRALGKCGGSLADIAEAIRWAAGLPVPGVPANATPARVISLSLGGIEACAATQTMQGAIDAAIAAGAVVVAATGNDGDTALISPANCNGVIAVTAHTINGENADYANIGPGTTISAPGGGSPFQLGAGGPTDDPNWSGYYVWSTVLFGPTTPASVDTLGQSGSAYVGFKGTSVAAPQVAGAAALIKSIVPNATAAQVAAYLRTTARPFPPGSTCLAPQFAGQCGAGLLDIGAAVSAAAAIAAPIVVAPPQSRVVTEGQATTFVVSAAGAPTLTYQWKKNGSDLAGATGASYTTPPLTIADSGSSYTVTVTNGLGSVTTEPATVTVVPPATGGGGGGGGAVPLGHLLLLLAPLLARKRLRRRE